MNHFEQEFILLDTIKKDFRWITLFLIPIGIVVNGAGGWVIAKLNIPFYLDSVGTILVAVVAGPIAGAITGVITNVILSFVSESYAPYWSVPLCIGLVAGFCANAGMFKHWRKVVFVGVFVAITAALLSTLIAMKTHGGGTFSFYYFLVEEPVDKIATALIVFGITRVIPKRLTAYLPRPENIEIEKSAK
jgi:energy-coupling factor transport system substrate-specific component